VDSAHAAGTLYGVASFSSFGIQSLYSIDASSGVASLVGSTGLRQISGISWDNVSNRLVALTVAGDQFALNTATGASTLIADGSFGVPEGDVAFKNGLAYTSIFDNLHTWSGSSWNQIGASGLAPGADVSGLAFGGSMLLGLATFGSGADQLVSFNAATGAASVIGATGTNSLGLGGLTHDFNSGKWFMTDSSSLYSIDTATGAASLIGVHGLGGFSGLAYVPGPAASTVLALAGLVALRRRR
jgi:hypothetical protein